MRDTWQARARVLVREYEGWFAPLQRLHTPAEWRSMTARYVIEKMTSDLRQGTRINSTDADQESVEWACLAESFAEKHLPQRDSTPLAEERIAPAYRLHITKHTRIHNDD
jgi:hypothetical protein